MLGGGDGDGDSYGDSDDEEDVGGGRGGDRGGGILSSAAPGPDKSGALGAGRKVGVIAGGGDETDRTEREGV